MCATGGWIFGLSFSVSVLVSFFLFTRSVYYYHCHRSLFLRCCPAPLPVKVVLLPFFAFLIDIFICQAVCVFVMDFYGGAVVMVVMDAGKCACVAPHCTRMCPLVGRCFCWWWSWWWLSLSHLYFVVEMLVCAGELCLSEKSCLVLQGDKCVGAGFRFTFLCYQFRINIWADIPLLSFLAPAVPLKSRVEVSFSKKFSI